MRDSFAYCETLVRAVDKDRFLATLFAPPAQRAALHSVYALNLELARVRGAARGPMAGEIRLQWWSEALAGGRRGEVAGSPVAAALLTTIARHRLPVEPLQALVEARRLDLYDEPPATLAEFEGYAINVSGNLFATAVRVLGGGPLTDALGRHAGVVHATAGLLEALPAQVAAGRLFLPVDVLARVGTDRVRVLQGHDRAELRAATGELLHLAHRHVLEARRMMGSAPIDIVPALLAVAPARATLERMKRWGYDPLVPPKLPQWQRQWLIWRAARRPQRIFG
jgi:phytoene synthase